jgi:hypothetical protein
MCKKHFAHTDTYQDVKKHRCVKNYEGTSKGMEAQALVEMLERAPRNIMYPFVPSSLMMIQMVE